MAQATAIIIPRGLWGSFDLCWLQDEWPSSKTATAIDSGDPAKEAEQTVLDTDLLHGSSGSSSLDGEIVSAGFGRPGVDELGEGSPQEASLAQGEWSYSPTKLGPTDFELLRVVGQGAFGKVRALSLSLQSLRLRFSHLRDSSIIFMPYAIDGIEG